MKTGLYTRMINAAINPIQFTNDADAEDYVLGNPDAIATVVENRVVVSTFYGADYGFSE